MPKSSHAHLYHLHAKRNAVGLKLGLRERALACCNRSTMERQGDTLLVLYLKARPCAWRTGRRPPLSAVSAYLYQQGVPLPAGKRRFRPGLVLLTTTSRVATAFWRRHAP
ncbi:hypothetical protein DSL92_06125 [Billgrantia gudaonensis]|uniref:Uncharacterized protein n=1 Tax=Billgrantia gudaonensis TaxID=376427 RepID=A0A432JIQ1_9GAMM|nr:hypothetical protein DSL92_06125 [Halomonas gudaonensis]